MAYHLRKHGKIPHTKTDGVSVHTMRALEEDNEVSFIIEKMLEGQQAKKRPKPTLRKFSWEAAEGGASEIPIPFKGVQT